MSVTATYTTPTRTYTLLDDGTLDTVVEIKCHNCMHRWDERLSNTGEGGSNYRDADTGEVNMSELVFCESLEDIVCPECDTFDE